MQPATRTITFDGAVHTVSPYASCTPAMSRAKADHAPQPVPKMLLDDGYHMYIQGALLRSGLRGGLTRLATEYAKNAGRMVTLKEANLLRLGGVKQKGGETTLSPVALAEALRKNPVLSLFGASTPWIRGKLMVGHAVDDRVIDPAVWGPLITDGVRSDPFRRDPEFIQWLDANALQDLEAQSEKVKEWAREKKEIEALKKAASAEKSAELRTQLRKALKDREQASSASMHIVSTLMPLDGFESIPQGAELSHRMRLVNATTREIGAMLHAIAGLGRSPLGAHGATGNGEISAKWAVREGNHILGVVGLATFEDVYITDADPENPVLTSAFNTFQAELSGTDLDFHDDAFAQLAPEADGDDED